MATPPYYGMGLYFVVGCVRVYRNFMLEQIWCNSGSGNGQRAVYIHDYVRDRVQANVETVGDSTSIRIPEPGYQSQSSGA